MVYRKSSRNLRKGSKRKSPKSLKDKNKRKRKRKNTRRLRNPKRSINMKQRRAGADAGSAGNAAAPVDLDIGTGPRPNIGDIRSVANLSNSEIHAEMRWILEQKGPISMAQERMFIDEDFYRRWFIYPTKEPYKKDWNKIGELVKQEIARSKELGIKWEPRAEQHRDGF